jgi:cytidine deaminase
MTVDWPRLRAAATEAMWQAYAKYSHFPVGAAGLVDDGRIVVGCNVENASYGLTLCAECGVVSSLHASGGGRLIALSCVDGNGNPLMPCGRCRQLLWEHGGPQLLVDHANGPLRMAELLPYAFGGGDLAAYAEEAHRGELPDRLRRWRGRGTVFVHPDVADGSPVWTAYWERSNGFTEDPEEQRGILEEGPTWTEARAAVAWGLARTSRVVVVDADGGLSWAGTEEPPSQVSTLWHEPEDLNG